VHKSSKIIKKNLSDEYWRGNKIGGNVYVHRNKNSGVDFAVKTKMNLQEEIWILNCLDQANIPRVVEVFEGGIKTMSMV